MALKWDKSQVILSSSELDSLVNSRNSSPHSLLGMHLLGEKKGLVVRAMIPCAKSVSVSPVHQSDASSVELELVHSSGVFECLIAEHSEIFAYDLNITNHDGTQWATRDPYSFLPTITDQDLYLFGAGQDKQLYNKLGAHLRIIDNIEGVSFAVWAPNAKRVSVVGDFNGWDGRQHLLRRLGPSGVWEVFIPGVTKGAHYKFEIVNASDAIMIKTDPFGFFFEQAPKNAAIVWETPDFEWSDSKWLTDRKDFKPLSSPISIYELHLGSWRKKTAGESPGYREIAPQLIQYLKEMAFTHVEFLPVAEHAYYPSWGYQVTGFYAPTSRYGTPDDFKYLVNELHKAGLGVLIDWVPAHFPKDDWSLGRFDGTALYEHADPRQGEHKDWGTFIFNFGRLEVSNFLTANALYWLKEFHIDGLRVDAVASMLYLDYSREEGEWVPNKYGGRENIDAIEFLKLFNHWAHEENPGIMTIAEESTSWPQVSRPTYLGGLGFSFKWNMGWMHDTLDYFGKEPIHRKFHQNELTFAMIYHHHENFVLPLSHDEVVHGKGSLLKRMPGDDWQRFANLRCLLAYQWFFPGKKLLFMGGEFGQSGEWNENRELEWWLLEAGDFHSGIHTMMKSLGSIYKKSPFLWEGDHEVWGFDWIDCEDHENCVISFKRSGHKDVGIVILNLTPIPRTPYRLGVPKPGVWKKLFCSNDTAYGGSKEPEVSSVRAESKPLHGENYSAEFALPPLSVTVFVPEGNKNTLSID